MQDPLTDVRIPSVIEFWPDFARNCLSRWYARRPQTKRAIDMGKEKRDVIVLDGMTMDAWKAGYQTGRERTRRNRKRFKVAFEQNGEKGLTARGQAPWQGGLPPAP